VRICTDIVSFPSLTILCTFLLTACEYLHLQSSIPVADRLLRVSAHRECVSVPTVSHSRRCLRISAHNSCVSPSTEHIPIADILCTYLLTAQGRCCPAVSAVMRHLFPAWSPSARPAGGCCRPAGVPRHRHLSTGHPRRPPGIYVRYSRRDCSPLR
jgi:hypothetical protein